MSRAVEGMLLGALSGLVATLPMTAAMSRLHQELPRSERYPLPPRELAEPASLVAARDIPLSDLTNVVRFASRDSELDHSDCVGFSSDTCAAYHCNVSASRIR